MSLTIFALPLHSHCVGLRQPLRHYVTSLLDRFALRSRLQRSQLKMSTSTNFRPLRGRILRCSMWALCDPFLALHHPLWARRYLLCVSLYLSVEYSWLQKRSSNQNSVCPSLRDHYETTLLPLASTIRFD